MVLLQEILYGLDSRRVVLCRISSKRGDRLSPILFITIGLQLGSPRMVTLLWRLFDVIVGLLLLSGSRLVCSLISVVVKSLLMFESWLST